MSVLLAAAMVGLFGEWAQVRACSCAIRPPDLLANALWDDARAVFLGEPYAVTPVMDAHGYVSAVQVSFRVHTSWKGATGNRLGLVTAGDEAACGFSFQAGRTYLIFAFETAEDLSAGLCSVKDAAYVDDEIQALNEWQTEPITLDDADDANFPPFALDAPVVNGPWSMILCGAGLPLFLGASGASMVCARRRRGH